MATKITAFTAKLGEDGKTVTGKLTSDTPVTNPSETLFFVFVRDEDEFPAETTLTPVKGRANREFNVTLSASEDLTDYVVRVLEKEGNNDPQKIGNYEITSSTPALPKPLEIKTKRDTFSVANKKIEVTWKVDPQHNSAKFNFKLVSSSKSGVEIMLKNGTDITNPTTKDGLYSHDLELETDLTKDGLKDYLVQIQAVKGNDRSHWGTELNSYYLLKIDAQIFESPVSLTFESGQTKYGLEKPVTITFEKFSQGLKKSFDVELDGEIATKLSTASLVINELDTDTATKEFNLAVIANLDYDILPGILKVERLGVAVRRMAKTLSERNEQQKKLNAISKRAAIKMLQTSSKSTPVVPDPE